MQINPDPNKQATGVIFSRKSDSKNFSYTPIKSNVTNITECPRQKHLRIVLVLKLNFNTRVD